MYFSRLFCLFKVLRGEHYVGASSYFLCSGRRWAKKESEVGHSLCLPRTGHKQMFDKSGFRLNSQRTRFLKIHLLLGLKDVVTHMQHLDLRTESTPSRRSFFDFLIVVYLS